LNYPSFEVILLPDCHLPGDQAALEDPRVMVIPTGPVIPPVKRNVAGERASGEIIAFIDSDAYPTSDWLTNAVRYFDNDEIVAVGGPGLTPESDSLAQKASGEILASLVGSWHFRSRHQPSTLMECDDIPSTNLLVRRAAFLQVKGFDPDYWTGEDTEFCLRITRMLNKKMLYAPDVVVYHHRRPVFRDHLRQISRYGLHRGYFARKFPETSRRPIYFAPSVLTLFLLGGLPLAVLSSYMAFLYLVGIFTYFSMCTLAGANSALKAHSLKMFGMVVLGTILTHLSYGLHFLKGLLSRTLSDSRP
jgi:cellulose synthase/poly-beta-1,6-N-acetylglucosamine synthase-like glycosyltransferase